MKQKIMMGVILSAVLAFPGISSAQQAVGQAGFMPMSVHMDGEESPSSISSTNGLQSRLQSLLKTLQQLQGQASTTNGQPSSTIARACHTFVKDLRRGDRGEDVSALQSALQNAGISISVTGNFGPQTAAAVKTFQENNSASILNPNGLSRGTGYVGAATRKVLNMFGCTGATSASNSEMSNMMMGEQGTSTTTRPRVSVTLDAATAASAQLTMGSAQDSLATFRFVNVLGGENVKITDLKIFEHNDRMGEQANFSNLLLYNGSNVVVTSSAAIHSVATSNPGPGYYYQFHFGLPIIIPAAQSISLTLKGDVATYASGGATDGSIDTFEIATSSDMGNILPQQTVVAFGATSSIQANISFSQPIGNPQTVLRSVMTLGATPLGSSTGRVKTMFDNFATITASANPAGPVGLKTLTVTWSGTAPAASNFLSGVQLLDANNLDVTLVDGAIATTSPQCNGANFCTKTWIFPVSPWVIPGGSSYPFTLRVNDFDTAPPQAGISQSLAANIQNAYDVSYADAADSSAVTVTLSSSAVPLNLNAVSFLVGT